MAVDDDDVEETDDDVVDEPTEVEDDVEETDDTPARPRRLLDGRTLAVCALAALVAALLAGLVTARITGGGDDADEAQPGDLTLAEEVPDLTLPTLDGAEEVGLAEYRGGPLVVNFWGSWCVPCVEEMPDLQAVSESLDGQVAFVGVNVNDAEEAARRMADTTGVTYDLLRDADGELIRALEVTTFPTTVLVDADGTIVDTVRRQVSSERLCEKINQSLMNQSLGEGDCG